MNELSAVAKEVVDNKLLPRVPNEIQPSKRSNSNRNNNQEEGNSFSLTLTKRGRQSLVSTSSTSVNHTNAEALQLQRQYDLLKEKAEQDKRFATAEQSKIMKQLDEVRKENAKNLKEQETKFKAFLLSQQLQQKQQDLPLPEGQPDLLETQQLQDKFSRQSPLEYQGRLPVS